MGCHFSSDTVRSVDEAHDLLGREREAAEQLRGRMKHHPGLATSSTREFRLNVQKRHGDVLGAGLGNTDKGAVIFNIQENGLLDAWNKNHPLHPLCPGLIITEVNGVTGYWSILEELRRPGQLAMKISATPPTNAGPNWFKEIADMGRNLEAQGGKSSFMLRLQPQDPNTKNQFSSLPTVTAGECGVDQCAICIEDVGPEESLVQLPCKHAFHALCAARWLTQVGRHAQGKRQCCPLCSQKVVCSPNGKLSSCGSDSCS